MEPSPRRRAFITVAILTAIFLAASEGTIVATAMPTIIGRLGGVALYTWVFTAYLLASTTTVPIYGKLADLYGRKPVFLVGVGVFMLGSLLCAMATSMEQLIVFRAIQGLGAGGVQPIAFTIVGDIFKLEERARIQGLTSGVWGIASVIAPAIGGLIVDNIAWQWIFLFNVPIGLVASALLVVSLKEKIERKAKPSIDFGGALLLSAVVVLFQFGLLEFRDNGVSPVTIGLLAAMIVLSVMLFNVERRASDPILPFALLQQAIIRNSILGAFFLGAIVFALPAFVPVFVQGARGGSATDSGLALLPMSLGWTIGAVSAGKLLIWLGYRWTAGAGSLCVAAGCFALALFPTAPNAAIIAFLIVLGVGAGFSFPCFMISAQNAVDWSRRGVATSSIQFARTIGGALVVAILGAVFTASITGSLSPTAGATLGRVNDLLDPKQRGLIDPSMLPALTAAVADASHLIFFLIALITLLAMVPAMRLPGGDARRHVYGGQAAPVEEAPAA